MRVLLVSTYELGRQPLHVASPAAALRRAGHEVRALDLSVEEWDDDADEAVAWAEAVGFSVYMHTSMRLAMAAADRIRAARPGLPICFYGLYAPVSRDLTVGNLADRVIAGEYEPGLLEWVAELSGGSPVPEGFVVHLGRSEFSLPARDLLPRLDRYARLVTPEGEVLVGAVEASHGCNQKCRHCPVPAVYEGRTRVLDVDLVMADIEQLAEAGARHITFADPDFLSGPAHGRKVAEAFGERFPDLTFDITTKVEHVLGHPELWPDFAAAGCLFAVSAVECVNDEILERLDKGHTRAMAARAVHALREAGIEPHPSFLAFTPWTTAADVLDILDFVADHDLVPSVDPVQYTLRLLVPEGSLLLDLPDMQPHLDHYDAEGLTWRWSAADPEADRLQAELAALVEQGLAADASTLELYGAVRERVAHAAGRPEAAAVPEAARAGAERPRPHLTEPWFCCAEPTDMQVGAVTGP